MVIKGHIHIHFPLRDPSFVEWILPALCASSYYNSWFKTFSSIFSWTNPIEFISLANLQLDSIPRLFSNSHLSNIWFHWSLCHLIALSGLYLTPSSLIGMLFFTLPNPAKALFIMYWMYLKVNLISRLRQTSTCGPNRKTKEQKLAWGHFTNMCPHPLQTLL